jgi:hypothetical protein
MCKLELGGTTALHRARQFVHTTTGRGSIPPSSRRGCRSRSTRRGCRSQSTRCGCRSRSGGPLPSTKRLCPGWRDALAEQYAGLASDDERTAFLDRLSALKLQRPGNHDDYLLQRGREHVGRELRRMTGVLLSGGGCIFCGDLPETLDQAHVARDGQATGSSGTVGVGDRPKRRTLGRRSLVAATTDGRVGMACINCHQTYDRDLSWIDPAELQAWVQESAGGINCL